MLDRLHEAVAAVCPILSVAVDRIDFAPDATEQQKTVANTILAGFDWSAAAQAAWLEDRQPDRKAIRQAAAGAMSDNDTFLALASPTNAQVLAQVKRLTQQNTRIIKRLIQIN